MCVSMKMHVCGQYKFAGNEMPFSQMPNVVDKE